MYQNAKDAAATIVQQLQGAESEVKALRSMTQRMILTQKEMVCINVVAFDGALTFTWGIIYHVFQHFRKK